MGDLKKKEEDSNLIQAPRGTFDILPEEAGRREKLRALFLNLVATHGFELIEPSMIEYSHIFNRSIGQTSDIVSKEMFYVASRDSNDPFKLALRPEFTAGIARAYIQHGLHTLGEPLKLAYFGPVFRHDRPQQARYRQFYQLGVELIGEPDASADAQVVLVFWQLLKKLEIASRTVLEINSLGCRECQGKYLKKLKNYLEEFSSFFDSETKLKVSQNPLRLLDSKDARYQKIIQSAPTPLDYLCDGCKKHFQNLLEYLDEINIKYDLAPTLARGLDYYNRTVFELKIKDSSLEVGGGGRYDYLIETLGGRPTPATGVSLGVDRVLEIIDKKVLETESPKVQLFVVQLGEKAKKRALKLIEDLTILGFITSSALSKESLRAQLKVADRLNARYSLIVGQREVLDGSVIVRDMKSGGQENIEMDDLEKELKSRLKPNNKIRG